MFSAVEDRGELGGAKCDLIRHAMPTVDELKQAVYNS